MSFLTRRKNWSWIARDWPTQAARESLMNAQRFEKLSDQEVRSRSVELSSLLEVTSSDQTSRRSRKLHPDLTNDILIEGLALATETARREFGYRPFLTQLIGAVAVSAGHVIDMKTGEGKTLTSFIAAYLAALNGRKVHLATTNAYLADRDAAAARGFYERLGLTSAAR